MALREQFGPAVLTAKCRGPSPHWVKFSAFCVRVRGPGNLLERKVAEGAGFEPILRFSGSTSLLAPWRFVWGRPLALGVLAAIMRYGLGARRRMGLHPKASGGLQCIDSEVFLPNFLIACLVQLPMVPAAERHGEFIADFEADGTRLRKAQVMRVRWLTPADQTGLARHELQMRLVP